MSLLGQRVVRTEDPALLTRGATYVADLDVPELHGAAHVAFVRSSQAHAHVVGMDLAPARALPGVLAVVAADEVDLAPEAPADDRVHQAMVRPYLAGDTVRFVGEPLAVVVAETAAVAIGAARKVTVEYRSRPPVVELADALADEVLVHPAAGTNTAVTFVAGCDIPLPRALQHPSGAVSGSTSGRESSHCCCQNGPAGTHDHDDEFFAGCEVVLRLAMDNQRLAGCPLEARSAAAAWGDDDRLRVWVSTQTPQSARADIATALGLELATVRVITPDVGGGFGPKIGMHREEVVMAWLAGHLRRGLRWTETRTENLLAMGHGRAQHQEVAIGGSRDGRIGAYRLDVVQDAGAYPRDGAILPELTAAMAPAVYDIERVSCHARSVVTTTMSTTSYRGAGRPEATAAIERAVDAFAAEVGLDPAEVRRRNLIPSTAFPFTTAVGTTYDTGDYAGALERVLEAAGYDERRAEQDRRRRAGDEVVLGLGLSCYVEVTAGLSAGSEVARVVLEADGSVTVYTGTSPHGQGHDTAWAMIAADGLALPMAAITVVHGDTDTVPVGGGTSGSRSLQLGGAAVFQACQELVRLADANGERVGAGADSSWAGLAASRAERGEAPLEAEAVFAATSPTYPFGAHLAAVEVDTDTGHVDLIGFWAVDDAGTVVNPLLAEGQRHGGIAQGVAQALFEEMVYDGDGQPRTTTLDDYAVVTAGDLPSFDLLTMATPTPINPLGAKGVGEAGTIGSTAAVQNAVIDALAHLGVRHLDLPCTPERVWRALEAASAELESRAQARPTS